MYCHEILVTLYRKGLIDLYPGKHDGRNQKRNCSIPFVQIDQNTIKANLADLGPIKLKLVRNSNLEPLNNSLNNIIILAIARLSEIILNIANGQPVAC